MTETSALDALGAPNANGEDAEAFVKAWHGHGSYDWLVAINQMRGAGGFLRTVAAPLDNIIEVLHEGDLDELVYQDGARWNLYHSAGYLIKRPQAGRRSGKKNIRAVPGVWLDLDVKEGAFASEDDALDFAFSLPVPPTITVATGTGGVQGYWRCDTMLEPDEAEELCVRWWQFAERLATCDVDKIQNRDRILRLPGSIRWPKADEAPTLVRLLDTGGPTVTREQLRSVTERVYQEAQERRKQAYESVQSTRKLAAVAISAMNRWSVLEMITHLEEEFNQRYDWPSILEPVGWTQVGKDYDERTLWSRPGGNGRKSATTDWVESPHVMSLFSDAEETGLRRLADAEIPLTKYRVYIELVWHGDEEGFVRAWIRQLEDEGRVG